MPDRRYSAPPYIKPMEGCDRYPVSAPVDTRIARVAIGIGEGKSPEVVLGIATAEVTAPDATLAVPRSNELATWCTDYVQGLDKYCVAMVGGKLGRKGRLRDPWSEFASSDRSDTFQVGVRGYEIPSGVWVNIFDGNPPFASLREAAEQAKIPEGVVHSLYLSYNLGVLAADMDRAVLLPDPNMGLFTAACIDRFTSTGGPWNSRRTTYPFSDVPQSARIHLLTLRTLEQQTPTSSPANSTKYTDLAA